MLYIPCLEPMRACKISLRLNAKNILHQKQWRCAKQLESMQGKDPWLGHAFKYCE